MKCAPETRTANLATPLKFVATLQTGKTKGMLRLTGNTLHTFFFFFRVDRAEPFIFGAALGNAKDSV